MALTTFQSESGRNDRTPDKVDPSELTAEERKVLASYWRYRGEGEMGAERFFIRLLEDMRVLEVPQPLRQLAVRARQDERKHGLWGRDWAVFFGDERTQDPEPSRTRELTFPGATVHQNRVLRIVFCAFTETVGCHVLQDIRPRIRYAPLRNLNREHLADELVHARVGWGYLATLNDEDKRFVQEYLPLLVRLLPEACCVGPEEDQYEHLVPLGYLTPRVLYGAHRRAVQEVLVPGLLHLAFDTKQLNSTALKGAA
jgi:hypothetical protein